MPVWYKCPLCHIFVQTVNQLIVHKSKHALKQETETNCQQVVVTDQLLDPFLGIPGKLDNLPLRLTSQPCKPNVQLTSVDTSLFDFEIEIKLPVIRLTNVDTPTTSEVANDISVDVKVEDADENIPIKAKKSRRVRCQYCNNTLMSDGLKQHVKFRCSKNPNTLHLRPLRCPILGCDDGVGYTAPPELLRHFQKCHQDQMLFKCNNCSQGFSSHFNYRWHCGRVQCQSRSPNELNHTKEELMIRQRKGRAVERTIMVYCDFCKLRMRKSFWSSHLLTCKYSNLEKDLRFRCSFIFCPTLLDIDSDIVAHFDLSHADIGVDTRSGLKSTFEVVFEKMSKALAPTTTSISANEPLNILPNTVSPDDSTEEKLVVIAKPRNNLSSIHSPRECSLCQRMISFTNFSRHYKICSSMREKSSIDVTSTATTSYEKSQSFERKAGDIKVEGGRTGLDIEMKIVESDTTEEMASKKNLPDVPVPPSSPSNKSLLIGKNIKKMKVKMKFQTRCRYCGMQISSSSLARHSKCCKARRGSLLKRNTTVPKNNVNSRSARLQKGNPPTVQEFETDVSSQLLHDDINIPMEQTNAEKMTNNHAISTDESCVQNRSKFRPRRSCPTCGIQIAGNLAQHLKICEINQVFLQPKGNTNPKDKPTTDKVVELGDEGDEKSEEPEPLVVDVPKVIHAWNPKYSKGCSRLWRGRSTECPSCGIVLTNGSMARHLRRSCGQKVKKIKCTQPNCTALLASSIALKVHLQVYHQGKSIKCNYCQRSFARIAYLRRHLYRSPDCGGQLKKEGELKKLETEASSHFVEDIQSEPRINSKTSVTINSSVNDRKKPEKIISTRGAKSQVVARRVDNEHDQCSECGLVTRRCNMARHHKACQKKRNNITSITARLVCSHVGCDVSFENASELDQHVQEYHTKKVNFESGNGGEKVIRQTPSRIKDYSKSCSSTKDDEPISVVSIPIKPDTKTKKRSVVTVSESNTCIEEVVICRPSQSKKQMSTVLARRVQVTLYECIKCGRRFESESGLHQHVVRYCSVTPKNHHKNNDWTCVFCMSKFDSSTNLAYHIRNMCQPTKPQGYSPVTVEVGASFETESAPENEDEMENMECGYCHNHFRTREDLMLHFRTPCVLNSGLDQTTTRLKVEPTAEVNIIVDEEDMNFPSSPQRATGVVLKSEEDWVIDKVIGADDIGPEEEETDPFGFTEVDHSL